MKTETILKKVYELSSVYNDGMKFNEKINSLIDELKRDIACEKCTTPSMKKSLKAAQKYLMKAKNSPRQILGYTDVQKIHGEEYQVFTDSYSLFMFKNRLDLPDISEFKDASGKAVEYPKFERIVPIIDPDVDEEIKINYADVVACLKSHPEIEKKDITYSIQCKNYEIKFNAEYLKSVYDILGTEDLKVYVTGQIRPAMFIDERTGNKAILVPLRKY